MSNISETSAGLLEAALGNIWGDFVANARAQGYEDDEIVAAMNELSAIVGNGNVYTVEDL